MENVKSNGGVDDRKYSLLLLALGIARGALDDTPEENDAERADYRRRVLDLTATMSLAFLLGYDEDDLTIDIEQHLTPEEVSRVKNTLWDDALWNQLPTRQLTSR